MCMWFTALTTLGIGIVGFRPVQNISAPACWIRTQPCTYVALSRVLANREALLEDTTRNVHILHYAGPGLALNFIFLEYFEIQF